MDQIPQSEGALLAEECLRNDLDDYVVEDLWEILIRNGFYLPSKGHWLTKKVIPSSSSILMTKAFAS